MSLSKKSKKRILIALVVLVIVGVGGYLYIYKAHKTLDDMEVVYTGSAQEFESKMEANADEWSKAGDKVIEVTGVITAKDVKGISVDGSFYFQLEEGTKTDNLTEDQKIRIKGRIIGYDDLLGELKLDKAIILKK
ncbi:hypothetical protein KORDIASMS9_04485 [Kordia sp. SMS9]|uniref:hypothetical protein n=1 Tax=Kordia sp. SMS9 TaxID=2282170 RepID=UPI000E0DF149|nr:hypothetical protein [Kordia sp. SMS9]AXG72217.1 hypothetical protein KORDIASMS9_04485 [Kordia sp. SMS9]